MQDLKFKVFEHSFYIRKQFCQLCVSDKIYNFAKQKQIIEKETDKQKNLAHNQPNVSQVQLEHKRLYYVDLHLHVTL